MNLSPVGKRDTLKACLQAAQLAAEKERERCEAREATADFAALPPSAQELQKVEWELQDLLADGERGDTLDSHDADVLELRKRIARLTAAQPGSARISDDQTQRDIPIRQLTCPVDQPLPPECPHSHRHLG